MKRQDPLIALLKQKGVPRLQEGIVWRRCRCWGQLFKVMRSSDLCCSGECQEEYEAEQLEQLTRDAALGQRF